MELELGEELKRSIESWKTEQDCNFLIKGQRFLDYKANQWEQQRLKKEQENIIQKHTTRFPTVNSITRVQRKQTNQLIKQSVQPSRLHAINSIRKKHKFSH
ncbi:protein regulator of cytokinesis 1-like [Emydura macquarii macquarii]|uniref:protein regulator of cytokinesis 1-like n=1 Tax=Emydura macquarii macquarii TaxID=1129001 RepID=UPI00352B8D23